MIDIEIESPPESGLAANRYEVCVSSYIEECLHDVSNRGAIPGPTEVRAASRLLVRPKLFCFSRRSLPHNHRLPTRAGWQESFVNLIWIARYSAS